MTGLHFSKSGSDRRPSRGGAEDGRSDDVAVPVSILVVEDQAILALDIKLTLLQLGYVVVGTATSADEAVKAAEMLQPDLVLMDIRLEGNTDGIEAAQRIRDRVGIPSVYLSAHYDAETLERANATQPLGFIRKPYTRALFESTLRKAVKELLPRDGSS